MQPLLNVVPLQPQTGEYTCVHAWGIAAHWPGLSVSPHIADAGKLQYCPAGQGDSPRLPQLLPVPVDGHAPIVVAETPAAAAMHGLP